MEPSKAPDDLNVDPDFPVMAVVYIAIQLLNQNPRRTRRHALAKIRKLAKFMSVSRIICPVLVDKDHTIIAGHARVCSLIAARKAEDSSLTSAIRVFIMLYYRAATTEEGHSRAEHGNVSRMVKKANLPEGTLFDNLFCIEKKLAGFTTARSSIT